jgi:Ser/Thr protein kinase RdoA (MazF antagonist)
VRDLLIALASEPAKDLPDFQTRFLRDFERGLLLLPTEYEFLREDACRIEKDAATEFSGRTAMHGDLNAGNLVFGAKATLTGVIDFESVAAGSSIADVISFLTSCCFDGELLSLPRFEAAAAAFSTVLGGLSRRELLSLCELRCVGFFGAVNLIEGQQLELRDIRRAAEFHRVAEGL